LRTLITLAIGAFTYWLCMLIPDKNLVTLIAKFAICALIPNILFVLCYFWTPEFKYFIGLIGRFFCKHKSYKTDLENEEKTN